jgi:hypothetical protein
MRTTSRLAILLGLLLGSGICAFADITWKLQDVDFSSGNQASRLVSNARAAAIPLPEPSAVLVFFVALAGVTGGTRLLRRERA